jgi:hypothetical protein
MAELTFKQELYQDRSHHGFIQTADAKDGKIQSECIARQGINSGRPNGEKEDTNPFGLSAEGG